MTDNPPPPLRDRSQGGSVPGGGAPHPGGVPAVPRSRSFGSSPRPTSVLGQAVRTASAGSRGALEVSGGSVKAGKLRSLPRPARVAVVFDTLKMGLRECIAATEEDMDYLRASARPPLAATISQTKAIEFQKQLRAAGKYKKKLELHLEKIEELEESYALQQQLRTGAYTMAKAYTSQPGSAHKKESICNVKSGYKECTQTMCAIEAQLESMLGTLCCKMKGLIGFARLMRGDSFEVTLKYGSQKWRSKGRIGDNSQNWHGDSMKLRVLLADLLNIKVVELRSFGKSVLLGQKNCETKDLFSSHPQLMTVNINATGSIKLNIAISWSPLEGVDENFTKYEPRPLSQAISKRGLPTAPELDRCANYFNGSKASVENGAASLSASELARNRLSLLGPASGHAPGPAHSNGAAASSRPLSVAVSAAASRQTVVEQPSFQLLADAEEGGVTAVLGGAREDDGQATCLEEALHRLRTALEDCQGQYPQLRPLEAQVQVLSHILRVNAGAGSNRSSDVSISIEKALGAFDFLESEDFDAYSISTSRRPSVDLLRRFSDVQSPKSTTKTRDSGIDSLSRQPSGAAERAAEELCGAENGDRLSSGNTQADVSLIWHLGYCERLLEHLGHFGPLRCKEIYALEKLHRQAWMLEALIAVAIAGPDVTDLQKLMLALTRQKELRKFWVRCIDRVVLSASAERIITMLERSFADQIRRNYDIAPITVFKAFVARVLDVPSFEPEASQSVVITLHQMMCFFEDETNDLPVFLVNLAGELWLSGRLACGRHDIIIKTILTFGRSLPPPDCLHLVALLLLADDVDVRQTATDYLQKVGSIDKLRKKALVMFLEMLEESNTKTRCAACLVLRLLKAEECLDQLIYVCQSDVSSVVKQTAKETLFSFGDFGRRAYQESQLTSHGFQGVNVRFSGSAHCR